MNKKIISPIAIDLGAKNTGVYFAHYEAESTLDKIQKSGKVYQLENNSYTYLMANRTAKRHQKRGYDRRQMAKRLFKLIWCEHFKLPWNKDTQQVIGFLFNRRGFSFLTEEYNSEILRQLPERVFDKLPNELKKNFAKNEEENNYDFATKIQEWAEEGLENIKEKYNVIETKIYTEKLYRACLQFQKTGEYKESKKEKNKLSIIDQDVFERLEGQGIQGLFSAREEKYTKTDEKKVNLEAFLNHSGNVQQILSSLPYDISEKDNLWDFTPATFKIDNADFGTENEPKIKTHLNHLTYALYNTLDELESGGRHRRKYFEEVKEVLKTTGHKHFYLKQFCDNLNSGSFNGLTPKNLKNLIGHISNLELKPLRKYFNDKKHRTEDYWDESRLKQIFERWILREWRVGEKDKNKAPGEDYDYTKLKNLWQDNKKSVVNFWLETDPNLTIPPYQDNNNRRPPRCQSLLLNANFLDRKYSEWNEWLNDLKKVNSVKNYISDYEDKLKDLQSGKNKSYFNNESTGKLKTDSGRRNIKELDARVLQFIFDCVKTEDPLQLNEIYSHAKKIRQGNQKDDNSDSIRKTREQLENAINSSDLHDKFKTKPNYKTEELFPEDSFLHLVCRYYKQRQRAREGRIFIHPEYRLVKGRGYEKTGRFNDSKHLLTYCNHKPRQKRHQMLVDFAALLQISPNTLETFLKKWEGDTVDKDEKLLKWLDNIEGLKTNCDRAAKEQKEYRGYLKQNIQRVFNITNHKGPSDKKLYKFCVRARDLCLKITEPLYNDSEQQKWKETLERNPASAVYLLAQINNIAFKERNGYANTCAVCSMDNAQRMQVVETQDGKNTTAKAQRLPAIPTRVIDGAVMRIARIVGGAIAKDKWEKVKKELKQNNKICIPIITESNQFKFEPSRETLVKGQRISPRKGKAAERGGEQKIYQFKEERIKEAGNGICPYTDKSINENESEIDHIIPRTSQWGTLNDEANLIWASKVGNHHKYNKNLTLADLKPRYKKDLFPSCKDDNEIKDWIKDQIDDVSSKEDFKFGPYRSFINLDPNQQTAFRHALFLVDDKLREKVIAAIDHRNQTLVNGTQRYFAEVLANKFYKLAKAQGFEKLLSFDYFGVQTQSNSRGDGIYELRKMYERASEEINKYSKTTNESQSAYSHLIDAQLAFVITADAHRNEGSLQLTIGDKIKEPYNKKTGEIYYDNSLLKAICIGPDNIEISLQRKKPDKSFFAHRSIHRDNMYAERYTPILVHKNTGKIYIGFDSTNSYELLDKKSNRRTLYFVLQFNLATKQLNLSETNSFSDLKNYLTDSNLSFESDYYHIPLDVHAIHAYYIKNYNTAKGYQEHDEGMEFLRSLAYRTERKTITKLEEVEKILSSENNFRIHQNKLILPVKREWEHLVREWKKTNKEDEKFLREFFRIQNQKSQLHEKVHKVFSLPIKTGEGKILVQRKSWNKKDIYQIVNDSDSRKVDAKVFVPAFNKNTEKIEKLLSESARSERVFLLTENDKYHKEVSTNIKTINPKKWYKIKFDKQLKKQLGDLDCIESLQYCVDNNTRPQIHLTFNRCLTDNDIDSILKNNLLKPKDKKHLKELLIPKLTIQDNKGIDYTGSGFNKNINQVLLPVLKDYYK